uniref:Retrovirus-related Pol polyprotein from transposon TNT 1-94 n=1 Tax=Tanacetum cinerariifolium TaxID=118510 RepID=A0A6L2MGC6_TANCI|nr:retrovirus-related Pol polyprotein from transposon TNT 1-94 [Tanacetum cinerariifolium]
MKANDTIMKNMQMMTSLTNSNLELNNMFGQFMNMNTASSYGLGTLPSNTITNPKEDLKGITTRSGNAYQEPTIPTTSSPPKVVERETEVKKNTVPPTKNESTKDVQPPVVQIETPIPNFELVVALVVEPVESPVSALKPNPKPSIPYPDKVLVEYTQNLVKVEKERDELKLTLEKLPNSSKSLNTLLNSQVSDKSKASSGYKDLIPESLVNLSELFEKQNNRSTKGYHEVPPPLTGNYMPLKRDLRLIDKHFESESVDVSTISSGVDKTVKTADITHKDDNREDELSPTVEVKTVKPSVENIESVKTLRETVKTAESHKPHKHYPRGNKRNWNNLMSHRLGSSFKMINKACYVCGSFEHLQYGNPQQKEYKEKGVIDSGCSRHMTGNKCYLTYFKVFDGGLVSFRDGKSRISSKVKQKSDGIFISQDKYAVEILKKFDFVTVKTATSRPDITFTVCVCARFQVTPKTSHLHAVKRIFRYLKGQPKLGLWYPKDSPFDLKDYSDSDYTRASLDRKSTTGDCQFLGKRLILWQCKKRTIVANSTTEVEYVAAANCYGEVLWIQNQLLDYGFNLMNTKIYIDNESTICIVKLVIAKDGRCFMDTSEVTPGITLGSTAELTTAGQRELVHVVVPGAKKPYWDVAAHIWFEATSKMFNEPPLSRVNTLRSGEDNLKLQELMATEKVNRVNDQEHTQALVDKKKVIITKDTIRSDLCFDYAEGTACLLNEVIFEGLTCIGAKTTAWNEFSSTMASVIICLADNQKFNFSKYIFDNMVKSLEGGIKFYLFLRFLQVFLDNQVEGMARHKEVPQRKQKPKRKQRKEVEVSHDELEDEDHVPTPSSDLLPRGEDSYTLNELMVFYTSLQEQRKSRSRGLRRLMKIGLGRRVKSSLEKDSLGAQEDASKQGRIIEEIDQDDEIALDDDTQGRKNDDAMFGVDDISGEEVVLDTTTGKHEEQIIEDVSTVEPVNTAGEVVTIVADKSTEPKVVVQEQEVSTTIPAVVTIVTTAVPTPRAKGIVFHKQKQLHIPTVSSSKDKGKAKMIEPEVPIKKKDQMRMDKELQAREREEFSEVQKARLLVELIEKRKKHFTALRAQEKRNKPPTKAQMRGHMCTYLRNMGGYKHSHLKGRSYDEIKKLFDREIRTIPPNLYHSLKVSILIFLDLSKGSKNRPPMLNKENYVPWSSRLLWYTKSRPNGMLIHNSIINGPYVRRMIPEPGDPKREVPVNETFHVQIDDKLTEMELKQIEADDQAIQTILLGLPEDIYAGVDSCETTQEIWLRVQQMMKGSDIGIQEEGQVVQRMGKNVKNQVIQNADQNPRIQNVRNQNGLIVFLGNANSNGNGNLVVARAEGNLTGHNGNQIRCYNYRGVGHFTRNCTVRPRRRDAAYLQTQLLIAQKKEAGIQLQAEEFDLIAAAADLDVIEEVNANSILMANLQQASTSGTQTDKAPVYDSDGSAEYTELLEPIPELHQVPQNDNNVISEVSSVEQSGGTVEQHPANVEETHKCSSLKSLAKEADESLAKHKALELEIECLLRAVVSQDIMSVVQNNAVGETSNLQTELERMFKINPFKPSREEKHVPNKVRTSTRTNPITVSQPPVITKKVVNSDSNGLSFIEVDNTKTRKPQPRSNTKNDRVPSTSKSSRSKNKEVEVEEHHWKLMLSMNKKHMSSECNNVKLATQNVKSKVVCAICKQCLISVNHDECLLSYFNGMTCRGKKQKENVSINEKQKKQQPKVKKTKKLGSIKRLASPKTSKPRSFLRWLPTGRRFDLKGKIITSSESESQSNCSNGDNACCSKHMTGNLQLLINFVWKFKGTVRFGNDHVAAILGFSDLQWGNILITRVYFVEGLGHNLFLVGQFCDSNLESNYVLEIFKKYGMEACDLVGTPMEIKDKFGLDQNGTPVDATKYRSMIGALMYLTSSRPDIVHATCLCAQYQAKPTEKHLKDVKRIFRYLCGTVNMGLWYTKDSGFELTGFSDADYARCKDTFKSTSGGAQFLGEKLVSWSSKKQDCTALSTAEAEYVSLSACYAQVLWMRTQLTDYGFHFNNIPIYCDSKSAIVISSNPVQYSRTKHIAVCYHFIKEHVEKGTIELYFLKTDYQLADLFTKALPVDRFNYLVRRLGMRSLSPQELDRLAKSQ